MLRRVIKLRDCLIAAEVDIGDSEWTAVALSWSAEIAINLNYLVQDKESFVRMATAKKNNSTSIKVPDSLGDQTNGETEYIQSQTSHR